MHNRYFLHLNRSFFDTRSWVRSVAKCILPNRTFTRADILLCNNSVKGAILKIRLEIDSIYLLFIDSIYLSVEMWLTSIDFNILLHQFNLQINREIYLFHILHKWKDNNYLNIIKIKIYHKNGRLLNVSVSI